MKINSISFDLNGNNKGGMSFRWTQVDEKFTGVIENKIFELTQDEKQIEYKCHFSQTETKQTESDITKHLSD